MIDDLPWPVAPTMAIRSASAKSTVTRSRKGPNPCMTSSTGRISRDPSRGSRGQRVGVGIEQLVEQGHEPRIARLSGEVEIRREQVAGRQAQSGADRQMVAVAPDSRALGRDPHVDGLGKE